MRQWVQTWSGEAGHFGMRDDGVTLWVKAPRGQAELDTFLRDDCDCSVDGPRCAFHAEMFRDDDKEAETERILV